MKRLTLMLACFFISMGLAIAQNKQVTGTIVDESGEPVIGASVVAKGTTTGTVTDIDGKFLLNVPTSATTLMVKYIGMSNKEVTISNNMRIVLFASSTSLDEVVVTALGITKSEKSVGFAVAKVNPEENMLKGEPDMLKAMQGRVAGIDIKSSQGMPGSATRINVRGSSSFFGDNQPLIIVDGVPLTNDQVTTSNPITSSGAYSSGFSSVDPNNIESMSVLKGSAASALYGSRASNGVVIIKTKSGSTHVGKKKTEVSLTSSMNWETIANYPDYQNTYGAGSLYSYSNANGSWGPRFSDLKEVPIWDPYVTAFPDQYPNGTMIPYVAKPNNVKDLFQTGFVWENSANISGGTEKGAFNATLSNLDHRGYVPNSSYIRNSISVGGSAQLSNNLNVRGSLSYVNSAQKGTLFGENQTSSGASSAFARSLFMARNWDLAHYPYEDANGYPVSTSNSQYDNPFWMYKHNTSSTNEDRIIASFGASYKITPWLKADYNLGTNRYTMERKEIIDLGSRANTLGSITEDNYTNQETQSDFMLTFNKNFMEDISLQVALGNSFNERTTTRKGFQGSEIVAPGIYNLSNTKTVLPFADDYYKNRLIGLFAEITVGYRDLAYLTFTGRNDWSSTLPKNSRSYFYPGVSGSVLLKEIFKIESDVLDYWKVRANWAKVGRDADPYSLYDIFVVKDPVLGQPAAGIYNVKNNPDLKPEFTTEVEVGTEAYFFNKRIGLDFAWYNKISTDQIAPIDIPYSSGYYSMYSNFGKIKNTGVEADLMIKPIVTKDWEWELHGIFTKNKNTVEELTEGTDRIALRAMFNDIGPYLEAGLPYGYIRGTADLRDDEGNLLIDPSTGLLIEDPEMKMIADPNPDYKLGISSLLKYKNVTFSALFDMTQGGQFYSVTINSLLGRGVTKDTEDREHAWILPGYYGDPNTGKPILDDNGNKIPNTTVVGTQELYFGQSFAINGSREWSIYDATVYRLREITLGYNVPAKFLAKTPFGAASIVFSARNLWYFAPGVPKHTNFDPEVNSYGSTTTQGFDFSAAPSTRRYGFTLNVTF